MYNTSRVVGRPKGRVASQTFFCHRLPNWDIVFFWLERDKTVAIQSVISIDERHFFWWSHGLVVSLEHTM